MIGRIKKDGLQQVAFTCDNKKDVAKIFFFFFVIEKDRKHLWKKMYMYQHILLFPK